MIIPYIPTGEYLALLRYDPKYTEIDPQSFAEDPSYTIGFLENMRNYQDEQGFPYSEKIHCYKLKKNPGTAKYYKHLFKLETQVYLFFEEESRYTYSNSPELYTEERLRQGLTEKEINEKGMVYQDYMSLLDTCPYCGKTMERGYITSGKNIHFDTNEYSLSPVFSRTAISLGKFWSLTQINCCHCVFCEKFIFDNPKEPMK